MTLLFYFFLLCLLSLMLFQFWIILHYIMQISFFQTSAKYSFIFQVYYFLGNLFITLIAAFFLHVLLETPIANLEVILLRKTKNKMKEAKPICSSTPEEKLNESFKTSCFTCPFRKFKNSIKYLLQKLFQPCRLLQIGRKISIDSQIYETNSFILILMFSILLLCLYYFAVGSIHKVLCNV